MNEARVLELADYIERLPHAAVAPDGEWYDTEVVQRGSDLSAALTGFNQGVHVCGGVGCAMAHACAMWPIDEPHHVEHRGAALLGIDEWVGHRLFGPLALNVSLRDVQPRQMADVLRGFAAGLEPEAAWAALGLADTAIVAETTGGGR